MMHLVRDERGMALVMAMLALLIISALIIGFSALSSTEPVIANNQLRVAQARSLAETGVERAIWALTKGKLTPGAVGSLAYPLPGTVPGPYDGGQLLTVSAGGTTIGGFRLTVSQGAAPNERNIVATGWVPDHGANAPTKAHQRITATVMDFAFKPLNMPCAVCVRGDIQIGGSSKIDSTQDTSCGKRYGTWSTRILDSNGNVISPGNTTIGSGAAKIYGALDNNTTPNEATDMAVQQNAADFDSNAFSNADLDALKGYAKLKGTYYQGTVTFNASNKIPNGVIFVDTVSGNNIDPLTTPTSDYASVTIAGNAPLDPTGFHGWVIVNGTLSINGNLTMFGMGYAVNDFTYTGIGNGLIKGQMVSRNIKDTIATVIDTSLGGNSTVTYDCAAATTGGGVIPQNFQLKAGTYKEVSD